MADRSADKYGFMILPDGKRYSLDDRQTRLNNNVLVVGTTGAAKTRTVITPNLLECVGSYVLTDPQGKSAPAVGALHGGARLPGGEAKLYSPGKISPLQSPAVCEKYAANPAAFPHHDKRETPSHGGPVLG